MKQIINIREEIQKLERELETDKWKGVCLQYTLSRNKRITELKEYKHNTVWTQGYRVMGCYECNGHKINCGGYINGGN